MNIEGYWSDIASVTPSGIRLDHSHYTCSRAIREQWFNKALLSGIWCIPVFYVPKDRTQLFLSEHDLEVCNIIQFKLYDEDKRNQYYELIEIYKKSKQKLDRLKRGQRHGYLR